MIEAETLVSIEELLNSTAAAVQPDDQIYAIVDASDPDAVGEISFREQARKVHFVVLAEAVNQGRITARSMATRMPFREWPPAHMSWERACEVHGVTQADADKFCAELALNRQQLPQPQAAAPAPVVAECANDAPVDGITTAQVAAIFDGIKYRAENWTRRLSDTKWLEPAKVALGAQGGASSLWNPATLARLIHGKERGTAKQKTLEALNRKFKSNPVLAPWRTAWDEHYEMFNDADGSH